MVARHFSNNAGFGEVSWYWIIGVHLNRLCALEDMHESLF